MIVNKTIRIIRVGGCTQSTDLIGSGTKPMQATCVGCNELASWPDMFAAVDDDTYDLESQVRLLFSEPIDWLEDVPGRHL